MTPERFGNLTKHKIWRRIECEALEEFFVGVNNLLSLEELVFGECRALKMVPESFGKVTKRKIWRMIECEAVEEFPVAVSNLFLSEVLNFGGCRALK